MGLLSHQAAVHGRRAKELMRDNERLLQTYCQVVLALFALGFMLIELRGVVLPFFFALFLSLLYIPLIDTLTCRSQPAYHATANVACRRKYKRKFRCCVGEDGVHDPNCWNKCVELQVDMLGIGKVPKVLAILFAMATAVMLLVMSGWIIYDAIEELYDEKDKYAARYDQLLDDFVEWAEARDLHFTKSELRTEVDDILVNTVAVEVGKGMADFASSTLLCLVFLIFILVARGTKPVDEFIVGNSRIYSLQRKAETNVKRYIVIKTCISLSTGVMVGFVLGLLGAPLPTVFGLITFILNFIPSIGSWIATLLPVPVILFDPEQTTATALLAICLPGVVQLIIGDFIEPHFLGRLCKVDPIVVLLSLMLFGYLWGIPGMVLAVPITIVTKLLCKTAPHPIPRYVAGAIVGDLSKYKEKLDRDMMRLRMSRQNLSALLQESKGSPGREAQEEVDVGIGGLGRPRIRSDAMSTDDEPSSAFGIELIEVAQAEVDSDDVVEAGRLQYRESDAYAAAARSRRRRHGRGDAGSGGRGPPHGPSGHAVLRSPHHHGAAHHARDGAEGAAQRRGSGRRNEEELPSRGSGHHEPAGGSPRRHSSFEGSVGLHMSGSDAHATPPTARRRSRSRRRRSGDAAGSASGEGAGTGGSGKISARVATTAEQGSLLDLSLGAAASDGSPHDAKSAPLGKLPLTPAVIAGRRRSSSGGDTEARATEAVVGASVALGAPPPPRTSPRDPTRPSE